MLLSGKLTPNTTPRVTLRNKTMKKREDCGTLVTKCVRQQLVVLYLAWLAVAGTSVIFIIIPGYQTLSQFKNTECTTVRVSKSGENSCTFCLQIHVTTTDAPSVERQLQQNELIGDTWCTFRSSCEMSNKQATEFIDGFLSIYGGNYSKYTCLTHKSRDSNLTILSITRYPQSVIIQLIIWLGVMLFILVACTMKTCRSGSQKRRETVKYDYRNGKLLKRRFSFHWKLAIENTAGKEGKDDDVL